MTGATVSYPLRDGLSFVLDLDRWLLSRVDPTAVARLRPYLPAIAELANGLIAGDELDLERLLEDLAAPLVARNPQLAFFLPMVLAAIGGEAAGIAPEATQPGEAKTALLEAALRLMADKGTP